MKLCASPPHHCELNPIEMVWGVLKNYVAIENKDMTIKSVEELFRKRHAELKDQPEFWKKCVEKVKRIEEDYRKSPGGGALQLHLYGGVWPQDWKIDPSPD